ncbi:hypothetical protein OGAPHI_005759 [Ogataea philodendri]|uniref:Pyruvate decarboxylase n=1 Tax=Ogataea philodendri TaxID=1378263 RepID=A0A9P8NZM6_9ASCO|nr:uncharacterized protein OGAPHI_005759 [Ogataea philodendri]KAH3662507.1 hypothetical protein OGAPHI_005759 [Ogataea philodendri]
MAPVAQTDSSSSEYYQLVNSIKPDYITISEYIFLRIYQLGIRSVFGVPGDFNLNFLEHLYDVEGLDWVGCCNELNSAYACDGYTKTCDKMSVMVTTYGVGELSALAGVAGMYSEYSPMLHIVGTSALSMKNSNKRMHHLLSGSNTYGSPDHFVYEETATKYSCVQGSIRDDAMEACDTVDHVIREIHRHLRPGYLFLPCDLTEMRVPVSRLDEPLGSEYEPQNFVKAGTVVDTILQRVYASQNMAVLVDYFTGRCKMTGALGVLLDKLAGKTNVFDTFMGKGIVSEDVSGYVGTYQAGMDNEQLAGVLEDADLVLHLGAFDVEMNSGLFTSKLATERVISMNIDSVVVCGEIYTDLNMRDVFEQLVARLEGERVAASKKYAVEPYLRSSGANALNLVDLSNKLESTLTADDVLIVDTGSFMFGMGTLKLHGARFVNQCLWAAIGFAIPATLGACIAKREMGSNGRVITVEGDGAAEMTLQELASLVRYGLDPVVYILNNDGYTIERVIKGPYRSYNDIATNWNWTQMVTCFGGEKPGTRISNRQDLAQLQYQRGLHLVELIVPKFDVPQSLSNMVIRSKSKS